MSIIRRLFDRLKGSLYWRNATNDKSTRTTIEITESTKDTELLVQSFVCKIFNDRACVNDKMCNAIVDEHLSRSASVELPAFYLGVYYPKRNVQHFQHDHSKFILRLKDGDDEAIRYFESLLCSVLSETNEFVVCPYPSSKVGYASMPLQRLVHIACERLPSCINGHQVIFRKQSVQKKSLGGSRNFSLEVGSIEVRNADIIRNRQVLLIDDVTTTGKSLQAGAAVLYDSGAELVVKLGLAQTYGEGMSNMHINVCADSVSGGTKHAL